MILAPNVLDVYRGLRKFQVQPLQVFHDDPRYRQVSEPLVIRRDDKPGRVVSTATRQRVLVCSRVVAPELPLFVVGLANLPTLIRLLEPVCESLQLFVFGDVQVELQYPFSEPRPRARWLFGRMISAGRRA